MSMAAATVVTVVICTRGRGSSLVPTIESILASEHREFTLMIVDQSDNDDTQVAVVPFLADRRLTYRRTAARGLGRARTLALGQATTEFVLFTDDDCTVDPDWVTLNITELLNQPKAAMVFGDVRAADDPDIAFTPVSLGSRAFLVHSIWSWRGPDGANVGIRASMAVRKSVIVAIGGFDEMLGPGSAFSTADDTDISLRLIFNGHHIVRSTRVRVTHFGHRADDEYRVLVRTGMFALGAVCGKLVRQKAVATLWFLAGVTWQLIVKAALRDLVILRRPPVLHRLTNLTRGILAGFQAPVQPSNRMLFLRHD